MRESDIVEWKESLNDKFEKEAVAFLNSERGGTIYIGIDDHGGVVGLANVDQVALQIKDRLKNNISPSTLGLFDIVIPQRQDCVQVILSGGNQKPYYVKKYGMCPEGCYLRVGTAIEKMTEDLILTLFQKRDRRTLRTLASSRRDLTFDYLKKCYLEKGYEIGENFLTQLELFDDAGKYNRLAYLLSDQFASPFQYARYRGDDVFDLVEWKTFSHQSILKSTREILDFLQSKNTTFTKITALGRVNEPKFHSVAVRELVINAIVHNDYRGEGMPTFEEFLTRMEISSFGGLPEGFRQEDFLLGYSLPVNPELIRVFRDLGFAERLGTGIRRVLKFYPPEIFRFAPSFLRVSLPLGREFSHDRVEEGRAKDILDALLDNPHATRATLCRLLHKSDSAVYRELAKLKEEKRIRRVGSNKNGYWEVLR